MIRSVSQCRPEGLAFNDPLNLDHRADITCDELALMKMLHYMRRDDTPNARDTISLLIGGYPDAHLIHAGLTFANRFPRAVDRQPPRPGRAVLRVVR